MPDFWTFEFLFQDGETFFQKNFWLKLLFMVSTLVGLTCSWIKKSWMTSTIHGHKVFKGERPLAPFLFAKIYCTHGHLGINPLHWQLMGQSVSTGYLFIQLANRLNTNCISARILHLKKSRVFFNFPFISIWNKWRSHINRVHILHTSDYSSHGFTVC